MTQETPIRGKYDRSVGALPDALAFVKPEASHIWVLLDRSGPLNASRIAEIRDISQVTVYRRVGELKEAGLVEQVADVTNPQADQYVAVQPRGGGE